MEVLESRREPRKPVKGCICVDQQRVDLKLPTPTAYPILHVPEAQEDT